MVRTRRNGECESRTANVVLLAEHAVAQSAKAASAIACRQTCEALQFRAPLVAVNTSLRMVEKMNGESRPYLTSMHPPDLQRWLGTYLCPPNSRANGPFFGAVQFRPP